MLTYPLAALQGGLDPSHLGHLLLQLPPQPVQFKLLLLQLQRTTRYCIFNTSIIILLLFITKTFILIITILIINFFILIITIITTLQQ